MSSQALSVQNTDFRLAVRRSFRVLWRGKAFILACLLGVLAPTLLYLQQATPRYTAEARIMVEAPEANDPLSDRAAYRPRLNESIVQTEAELVGSVILARRAVEKLKLYDDPEFNAALREPKALQVFFSYLNPLNWFAALGRSLSDDSQTLTPSAKAEMERTRVVRAFLSRLDVKAQRRSFVIVVRFSSESREKAARITNTLSELYVLDRLEASFEDARRLTNWLGERLDSLRKDALAADSAVEEYRARYGLRRKGDRQNTMTDQQLSEINTRLVIARTELAQKRARLDQVRQLSRSKGFEASSDVLQSPLIQRLREQEAQRQREMSEALKTYGDRHPRILGMRADLAEMQGKIAAEIEKIAASIANDMEVAATGVRTMERELEAVRQQSNSAGEAEVRLRELERQAEASRSLYEAFLGRFKKEAEQEGVLRANARIVSPAEIPGGSTSPPTAAILMLAVCFALTLGVALVLLLERLDNSIRSSDEMEELAGAPTLAMVPIQRGKDESPATIITERPRSALADAVRSLRTALERRDENGSIARIFVVTSSIPKEGKTFVSTSLAVMMARGGHRVLVIDGDVHRPRMHASLNTKGDRGLAETLRGEVTVEEAIQRGVAGDNMDFLAAGSPADASELIKLPQMSALLEQLIQRYDRIIIDSPPVLAVTDARILSQLADRVLYLVKWNSTPRDAIRNGLKLLGSSGIAPYGMVLSQVNQRKHARYGYGDYGHYYGRYKEYYGE